VAARHLIGTSGLQKMKIVAVMACRNEAAYLATCLHHLMVQGIHFAVVDNGSTDDSLDIIRSPEFSNHLVGLRHVPFDGSFELEPLLKAKMGLADEIEADWAMNICPDEILHPNREGSTLLDEIQLFDQRGFNAVNFDEFVFLPVAGKWEEGLRGWPRLRHYYFFEAHRFWHMRAWKKGMGFSMSSHGGHILTGPNELRFAPESLVLRHYIFRDQEHAYEKLPNRRFAARELERGWHRSRNGFSPEKFTFPSADKLEVLDGPDSFSLSRARPWLKHYWQ
jgi:glycosyltransferase involved in cell wall biosynthesis